MATSPTPIAKDPLVDTLAACWTAISALFDELPDAAWQTPTALPGWTVHDVVAHLIGTERSLAGEPTPEADLDVTTLAHVRNGIAASNECWVRALREETPERMRALFRETTAGRHEALRAMSQQDFDAPSWTPAGEGTYGRFMQIRLFDCWMHDQDIRDVTGRPGDEEGPSAEGAVDEIVRALGYVVGKRAGAPDGSTVTIELTGPVRRTVHVAVEGRATLVPRLPGPATARITLPSTLFTRLAGGRVTPQDHLDQISLRGDENLGRQIATNLSYTV